MNNYFKRYIVFGALVSGLACALSAHASIVLNNTRVVYAGHDREVSVKLTNSGDKPALVQSWIDDGDVKKDPSLVKLPFILMPPITRIDPGKGQTLRLIYTGEEMPQNRESVFYLNVLEIPPKDPTAVDNSVMQLALRTRVKLFYRPDELESSSGEAPKQLRWNLINKDSGWVLECSNPTSFYVSMTEIALTTGTKASHVGDGMVESPRVF